MTSTLTLHTAGPFDADLKAGGVSSAAVQQQMDRLKPLHARLAAWRAGSPFSFFTLPFLDRVQPLAERGLALSRRFARTVVFGIGGSSLGGEMLVRVLGDKNKVWFFDNIDPETLLALDTLDWRETLLLVISKSGQTAETLSQFLTLLPTLEEKLKNTLAEHVIVITENQDGALARVARELKLPILEHPSVGGRFSVLSVVGLLPAAIAGVDIAALLRGAQGAAENALTPLNPDNTAFYHATLQYVQARQGRHLSVMMIYADRLRPLAAWYRQLLGESLGKKDGNGNSVGLTPIDAYGVTDQHSQLQLYLDGPDNKQYTFLVDPNLKSQGRPVPNRFARVAAVEPLVGHTTGEIFTAEFNATRETLTRHRRPNRTIALTPSPASIGELILLLELETVAIAELLGIDAFDQPAVEESKVLTREYLNKK